MSENSRAAYQRVCQCVGCAHIAFAAAPSLAAASLQSRVATHAARGRASGDEQNALLSIGHALYAPDTVLCSDFADPHAYRKIERFELGDRSAARQRARDANTAIQRAVRQLGRATATVGC